MGIGFLKGLLGRPGRAFPSAPQKSGFTQPHALIRNALPHLFHQDHSKLAHPKVEDLLRHLWASTGESHLTKSISSVHAEFVKIQNREAVLVSLPWSTRMLDCPFLCLVLPNDAEPALYLTYEVTVSLDGRGPKCCVCSWSDEGNHINFGHSGPIDRASFLASVGSILRE
jgi:hypothetical protein